MLVFFTGQTHINLFFFKTMARLNKLIHFILFILFASSRQASCLQRHYG